MYKKTPLWHCLKLVFPLAFSLFPVISHAACNAGDVGGAAYLELPVAPGGAAANIYGQREANEPGLTGITVKVTDSTGKEQSVTTDANGDWSVAAPAFPLRVEFAPTTGLQSGAVGSQSKSSVRFVDATACDTNMGFQRPEDYSQPDPRMVIPGYRNGTGIGLADGGVFSFLRSSQGLNKEFKNYPGTQGTGPIPDAEASVNDVGSLWGIGWQANKKRVFASAFLKRHVGVRDGLGYVYAFDETTAPGKLVGKFNLQGVTPANGGAAIDLGSVCRDATCASQAGNTGNAADYVLPDSIGDPSIDMDAFYKVGTVGFGDIDVQPGTNTLWLVNANQKALISVDASAADVALLPGTGVNQYPLATLTGAPSCTGGQLHPWALGFFEGKGYVGLSCDAVDSQDAKDLHAYVMSFNPANVAAGLTPVLDFPLNYARDSDKPFEPWMTVAAANSKLPGAGGQIDFPHGILSDIDFDERGNLYLEVMDLFAHQTGNYNHLPFTGDNSWVNGIDNGDVLKACKTAAGFSLEGSADCPVNTASSAGPNGAGEFFDDTAGDGRVESAAGAIAMLRGSQELNGVLMDPHPQGDTGEPYWSTQGVITYSLNDGKVSNWYTLNNAGSDGYMGKGTGFGDIELLSDTPPVEVGNRVWLDKNNNGIQDADEVGIDGVDVKLVCVSGNVTATTANGGQYVFSNATGGNAASMKSGESCTIQVDSSQAALKTYTLTKQDADTVTDNNPVTDLRDSDAKDNTGMAEITFTVGNAGENNHTLDIGYQPPPPKSDLSIIKAVDNANPKHGDTVVYTLTVTNQGPDAATAVNVTDVLPAGITYVSDDGAGAYDKATGIWAVGALAKDDKKVLSITATVN
ncbi:MAG: SdrD B-like domain-containing protein [Thiothrix sp.]|uniref:SdrD B-like domain-containing protein n=1 Tax=Thiothrix sp. TaxID=1032 RepID=UPI0026167702|nr:SdrD B-like domain-containing protein [Thiothrix sp.]MDD5392160.1 SdrD B-like domain-containing protein [Thiothrix sp.]